MSAQRGAVTAHNAFILHLDTLHGTGQSWRDVGAKFGLSGAMAFRIARRGYWPADRGIRAALAGQMYDAWRAANAGKLAAIVAWAEQN